MRKLKRLRQRTFVPRAEHLESRIALSAQIGVSLDSNDGNDGDPIWTDLHNAAFNWVALPTSSSTTVPLTADGYPLVNAEIGIGTSNYPAGDYGFSYTGAGTVTFSGAGQLAAAPTVSDGVTTGTVVVNSATAGTTMLTMTVTGVNLSDPMDNFHLMMPGYGNGTTPEPMFTPAFLKTLEPFSDIRFVNWDMTGGSTVANWSQRVAPTALTTTGTGNVPYEDMIELCNEAQKDMWINVPTLATPAFVQDLAQLIDTDLDPNLHVYVEYSNETWNDASPVFAQVYTAAKANPLVALIGNQSVMVAQQSAYEEVLIAKTFDQVFGSGSARVRPIMAAQAAWSQIASWQLQFIQQNYGPPSQFIYASAVGPYVTLPSGDNVAGLTVNGIFTELNQYLNSDIVPWLRSDATVAEQYGVPLVAYEGGQGIAPGPNDLNLSVMQQAQNDPRMYQLYIALIEDWQAAGGGLFNAYQLTGQGSQYGFWGMLPNVLSAGSQKYDALLSMISPAGDANLDGTVDYADFQAVEANYGTTGDFWEQGDFNDDGTVNWQDLDLLRQDLDPAGFTLAQFAQQALFGQLSTVDAPTALEYDGYGVTSASSMSFSASSGTVKLNQNSQGQAIVLGGASYSEGLGVLANSSVSLALDGQYTRFESTIGVDGTANSGSSVIYDVYGDGQLLYQSPTLTYGSGVISIDVNVSGVTKLTLEVLPAPGSNPAVDNAVWADARLVSTANFGSTTPYTLTWQLSQNGTVLSTQTTDSFVFAAMIGTYTLTLTVADAQGDTATSSTTVTVVPAVASASHFMLDANSEGTWVGSYGTQGYEIDGGAASLPDYATVTFSKGVTTYTFASSTADPRGLQNPTATGRSLAAWNATSFTVDVDLTDGQSHDLELYFDDWLNQGRTEQVQLSNATTGAVLDTETISSFASGIYLRWAVSGNISITFTRLAGPNAILSGLFFDPISATSAAIVNKTTEGNWVGVYGAQGYDIIGGAVSLPSYATITPALGVTTYTFTASTTDPRALENPTATGRSLAAWNATSFTVDVDLTDGQSHELELYFDDWLNQGRSEVVQIGDVATGELLDTETVSSFASGVYLDWTVSGDISITLTCLAGPNAILNGLFLDPIPASDAAIVNKTTEGNWVGVYGAQGYDIIGGTVSLPSYATITPSEGVPTYTFTASTTDPRALENPTATGRSLAAWNAMSFTVDVDLTDGQSHELELYFDDWLNQGRIEQVQLSNATTGAVLDTETISSFASGVYLEWTISGNILITFTRLAGPNAILSGLFLDPILTTSGIVTFTEQDATTEGNWVGVYGAQGYDIIGGAVSLPSYATITPSKGVPTYTFTASTIDPRALENPTATGRSLAAWNATSFTVDVDLTDGQSHELELYFDDWLNQGRTEQVQLSDAITGAVLDTETISSFASGVYLDWTVSGDISITFTRLAGPNAILSGLFFDPIPATSAVIVKGTTEGTGVGVFAAQGRRSVNGSKSPMPTEGTGVGVSAAQGYDLIVDAVSLSSPAIIASSVASASTWVASTAAPRVIQDARKTGSPRADRSLPDSSWA